MFFRNLLFGESNVLQSRYLIVGGWKGPDDPTSDPTSNPTSKRATARISGPQFSLQVRRLLVALDGEMTRAAIMKALTLRDRVSFGNSYLGPALKIGLVEMTQPGSPRSPTQRYRLTAWGQKAKASLRVGAKSICSGISLTASRFAENFGVKPQVSHTVALGPPASAGRWAALANEVFETWASPSFSSPLHQSQIVLAPPLRPIRFFGIIHLSRV